MSTAKKTSVEYIGPLTEAGKESVWYDEEGDVHKLVVGQRYPVSEALAKYMVEHDPQYWKRPDPLPVAKTGVKE